MDSAYQRLAQQVERFRAWAPPPEQRGGEWETAYEGWAELRAAAEAAIERPFEPEGADLLLYVLARDHEDEALLEGLRKRPALGRKLAPIGLSWPDPEARWQLADFLGDLGDEDAARLLLRYADDSNEYVRRRAMLALARHHPEDAELVAVEILNSEHRFGRLAALRLMRDIGAKRLGQALDYLRKDPSPMVREEARRIARSLDSRTAKRRRRA